MGVSAAPDLTQRQAIEIDRMTSALYKLAEPVPGTKGMGPKDRANRLHAEMERRIAIAREVLPFNLWEGGRAMGVTDEEPLGWKATVRDLYDEMHFGRDNVFTGSELAGRVIQFIEDRHPTYFTGHQSRRKPEDRDG